MRWLVCGATILSLGTACGRTTFEEIGGPTGVRCQLAVAAPPPSIPASGSMLTLEVSTDRDCTWTAASETSWLTITPPSGQGSASLLATIAANGLGTARSSTVTVNEVRLSITQQGVPCRFELGDQGTTVGPSGARKLVHIKTVDGCEWRASSGVNWVRVLTGGGTGSTTIALDVDENPGRERSTVLTIAGIAFTVVQTAVPVEQPAPPTPSPPCTVSIEPGYPALPAEGGTFSFNVIAGAGCVWTADSTVSWITVLTRSGSGSAVLSYRLSANPERGREGTIVVAGHVKQILQYGIF